MTRKYKKKSTSVSNSGSDIFTLISYTFVGKLVLYGFIAFLVVLITAIATADDFDKFFKSLGVEILIATLVGWIISLALKKN